MVSPLIWLAALLLLAGAVHLTMCRDLLRALAPIPGEARLWFRPFLYAPLIPVCGLAAYALAPDSDALRYALGAAIVASGVWLAVLFTEQRHLYAKLASARERRVLIRYTLAMFGCAESAIVCLLYGPITNTEAITINLAALIFGTFTINLIVASLHHRAVIQEAERGGQNSTT